MWFIVENGVIWEFDIIYWSSGVLVSVIKYYEQCKEYIEIVIDLDGKIIVLCIYDGKGNFLCNEKEKVNLDDYLINGCIYNFSCFQLFYFYNENECFDFVLKLLVL